MNLSDINERYKQIKGFKDYYITESGDVCSTRLRGNEKTPHLHKLKPKNPGKSSKYYNIILCREDGQYTKSIHRLVVEHFVDGYFDGAVVNHIDGDNRNNVASNLEWTTIQDNVRKSYITSGISQVRNYITWELYNPDKVLVGSFCGHTEMEKFIRLNKIDVSPTWLTKSGKSRGYTVIKKR